MNTSARLATILCSALLVGLPACEKSTPAPKAAAPQPKASPVVEFRDSNFGFGGAVPQSWQIVPSAAVNVPGTVLQAWTPGPPATVVTFVQEAPQLVTAQQLLDSSAAALKGAGCTVTLAEVANVGGKSAMSLKVTGPGNGAALGAGTVTTYQHWVAVPRDKRVLVLLFTAPDASKTENAAAFETMTSSLKID